METTGVNYWEWSKYPAIKVERRSVKKYVFLLLSLKQYLTVILVSFAISCGSYVRHFSPEQLVQLLDNSSKVFIEKLNNVLNESDKKSIFYLRIISYRPYNSVEWASIEISLSCQYLF